MPAASLTLSVYNMVIDACARQGEAEKGADVFKAMMSAGVTPDVATYSAVIKAYVVQGDLEQAVQLFTLMRKRGVQPDVGLFNTLLDGLARKQMSALVGLVLQDMESSSVAPTTATLAILVKMYGRSHDLESAFAYIDSWKIKYNLESNAQVLAALLTACANSGDMAKAQEVFAQLRTPDSKAYTAMVQGHLKAQSVKDALRLLEDAVNQQVVLDQELIDNAMFMADRRNLATDSLKKKLSSGSKGESPAAAAELTISRRKQGKWREAVAA
jgi:pentatricopeptide repeat protein